jgi:hypothetical protein
LIAVAPALGSDAAPPAATLTASLAGMTDTDSGEFEPPDTQLGAGPGFVVEMVNVAARIWRTGGGAAPQVTQTVFLSNLFRSGNDQLTDPRVEYDTLSQRWFASASDVDASSVLLAVSRTSDPSGPWSASSFRASGCADQPHLGMADGVVVVGADVFANCNAGLAPVVGAELWIVNKQQLLDGVPSPSFSTFGPDSAHSTFAPVQSLSSSSTQYVVSVDNPSSGVVHLLGVDGIPPATVSVQTLASIRITSLLQPPPAQQPSGSFGQSPPVATNDDRILDSVWENGRLWFSANSSCIPAGDSSQRSCGRVAELSTVTRTLAWETDIGDAGAYVYFPAVRPDAIGNLVVGYGESSSTIDPQLRVVVRAPDGTTTAPVVIAESAGPHLGNRFGDYFGAARDPVNPSLVWVAGEIGSANPSGSRGWSTGLGSVLVSGGGVLPVTVPVQSPPRLRALAASGRVGAVLRLRFSALEEGTGIREQVTVRSSSSGAVVYSATSAKGPVHAGSLYSLPWRARHVGRFSFCVRSLVASGAKSAASCATATVRRR